MAKRVVKMAIRYTPEFRQQIIDLVAAGRSITDLVRQYGCTATTIHNWLRQESERKGPGEPLSNLERDELERLRRENQQLRQEREILSKAAAWFAQETLPNSKRSSDS